MFSQADFLILIKTSRMPDTHFPAAVGRTVTGFTNNNFVFYPALIYDFVVYPVQASLPVLF
ncbi:MAG: hypothetical protein CVU64_21655 [Deltaproteobacteria bacterium HGW-Deltaproteobacteria-21]|nr:MAG: hypothetical protein CVU64_21655 [Deltaproteobacteria bacterium HGW-Deltaproteobacteria-21]